MKSHCINMNQCFLSTFCILLQGVNLLVRVSYLHGILKIKFVLSFRKSVMIYQTARLQPSENHVLHMLVT
jgi:hypothetical protein